MGKTERRLPRERERSGREPLRRRGHASTGLSIARGARCAVLVRTVVSALSARIVVGRESASTVVCALCARSAVVHKSASTVVGAVHARSAGSSSHHDSTLPKNQKLFNTSRLHSLPPTHQAVSSAATSTAAWVVTRLRSPYTLSMRLVVGQNLNCLTHSAGNAAVSLL